MNKTMRPARRRLTLTDLMILIAGFAVGLWVAPGGWDAGARNVISMATEYRSARMTAYWSSLVLVRCAQPVAAAWTLSVLAARLWRRPSARRLAREPGAMACIAAALAMIVAGPLDLV